MTYTRLQLRAAYKLECDRAALTYERFGNGRHLFKGCGRQIELLYHETGYGAEITDAASNRFSKEIKCDLDKVAEEPVDHKTHIVEGCGRRITYVQSCDRWMDCTWVANVDSSHP